MVCCFCYGKRREIYGMRESAEGSISESGNRIRIRRVLGLSNT